MAIRVYEYGLLPPTLNASLVLEQMKLAHHYRNKLVEIERQRREAVRAIMASHPDVAPLEAELAAAIQHWEAAKQAILAIRSKAKRRAETAEMRAAARELGAKIKDLRSQIRDRRQAVVEASRPQLDATAEVAKDEHRKARATCGVYWGTYLLQEAAIDQARKEVSAPKFFSWREEGAVSVQLQKGLDLPDLWGTDTQLQVKPVDPGAHDPAVRRGQRRRLSRTVLRLRVGSDSRKPIWAEFPMIYHRPLPEGAVIKVATVHRRRRNCTQWSWVVQMTVDVTACKPARVAPATGVVALNLGYRKRDGGAIRAGYVVGNDGHEEEILAAKSDLVRPGTLTAEQQARARGWVTNGLAKADSIRGFRDRDMLEMKAKLPAVWPAGDLPEWFAEVTKTIQAWKSPDRFRRLSFRLDQLRASGDEAHLIPLIPLTDLLSAWRARDEHLEMYEAGLRRSAIKDRREAFRIVAARLAQRYATLVVDTTDLRRLNRAEDTTADRVTSHVNARHQSFMAAPGELRETLINAFGPDRVVKVSRVKVTVRCHHCGHMDATWDRERDDGEISHACPGCGVTWDQDANACRNLLKEHQAGNEIAAAAATPQRAARLRAAAAARKARAA